MLDLLRERDGNEVDSKLFTHQDGRALPASRNVPDRTALLSLQKEMALYIFGLMLALLVFGAGRVLDKLQTSESSGSSWLLLCMTAGFVCALLAVGVALALHY
jgi:hypothetical protein